MLNVPLADETDPYMRVIKRLTFQRDQFLKRGSTRAKANAALIDQELAFLTG
jgi:hypothetical protein